MDADDLGALALELDTRRVREAPGSCLGCRVGREQRYRDSGDDRENVDEGASAVALEHRRERLGHRDKAEVFRLELRAPSLYAQLLLLCLLFDRTVYTILPTGRFVNFAGLQGGSGNRRSDLLEARWQK